MRMLMLMLTTMSITHEHHHYHHYAPLSRSSTPRNGSPAPREIPETTEC